MMNTQHSAIFYFTMYEDEVNFSVGKFSFWMIAKKWKDCKFDEEIN